jgi:hypothetical protein
MTVELQANIPMLGALIEDRKGLTNDITRFSFQRRQLQCSMRWKNDYGKYTGMW